MASICGVIMIIANLYAINEPEDKVASQIIHAFSAIYIMAVVIVATTALVIYLNNP